LEVKPPASVARAEMQDEGFLRLDVELASDMRKIEGRSN